MNALIGVDVGATTISAGIVASDGEVLSAHSEPSRAAGPASPVERVLALVTRLVDEAGARAIRLDGIGIGLPGLVDVDKGMMIDTANPMAVFAQVPLAAVLREATGLPVHVDNDVNVLALGEAAFGAGRGADSLVVLALGTGFGGAVVVEDRLVRGHSGCAGEFGHIPIQLDAAPCACGGHGCLNLWVGGDAIAAKARAAMGVPDITTEMVFRAAAAGDARARRIVDGTCAALGVGVASIVNSLNPEVVVITGGVAASLVPLEPAIRGRIARHALPRALAGTRIHIVPGDKRRTLVGGAALVLYELQRTTAQEVAHASARSAP
jgi:glucokinase